MIKIEDLTITFKNFKISSVNLNIEKGEYFVIIGPTGSGKSMLLETIVGLRKPDKGRIWLEGKDITNEPPERRGIGFVYQDYFLFPHLTVRENISFGLKGIGLSRENIDERVKSIASTFKIGHLLDRYPETLSGGE